MLFRRGYFLAEPPLIWKTTFWQQQQFPPPAGVQKVETKTETVFDWKRLSMMNINCLWRTQSVCYRQRLSVKDTHCLWPTQTVLWKTQTVCDKNRLRVTEPPFFLSQISLKPIYAFSRTVNISWNTVMDNTYCLEPWQLGTLKVSQTSGLILAGDGRFHPLWTACLHSISQTGRKEKKP